MLRVGTEVMVAQRNSPDQTDRKREKINKRSRGEHQVTVECLVGKQSAHKVTVIGITRAQGHKHVSDKRPVLTLRPAVTVNLTGPQSDKCSDL